ncbi:hypothetical protein MPNT_10051 [Candidatus Methylacidithermus pantelleriae]|uniref:Uncharacterized protein n=1 Tax=Candidatus Methylacidithermus pantelleriae TaxID=2744239 RepID=A0A8J2BH00_9BACT|nr:hypothetical protein MPNT_10051 [Candidatus Methylacidithermus pantelleriae]
MAEHQAVALVVAGSNPVGRPSLLGDCIPCGWVVPWPVTTNADRFKEFLDSFMGCFSRFLPNLVGEVLQEACPSISENVCLGIAFRSLPQPGMDLARIVHLECSSGWKKSQMRRKEKAVLVWDEWMNEGKRTAFSRIIYPRKFVVGNDFPRGLEAGIMMDPVSNNGRVTYFQDGHRKVG